MPRAGSKGSLFALLLESLKIYEIIPEATGSFTLRQRFFS
jgi:hypothetical protein